jgi:hypothetical protein
MHSRHEMHTQWTLDPADLLGLKKSHSLILDNGNSLKTNARNWRGLGEERHTSCLRGTVVGLTQGRIPRGPLRE